MTKVHLIFNAHLDPIWLWSWRDGLDEVLNTSHYICNLLDRHPDIIYTRGEAWVYEQIRRIDPALFERVRGHIRAGRWSLVGGWYIQPDCNQPSGFALERQISLGQELFREYFGSVPKVAYNVDSFGHAATFPAYMQRAGQSCYVMMRPAEHEMKLPARLFRWRGYADGPEVTTFRIARAYNISADLEDRIRDAATELPEGISHTMCFVGIGDHGGGPTDAIIEWCRANQKSIPCLELVFSSPEKFFDAIQPDLERLPVVTGELQMHAIGCYSVHRPVKTSLRKAEHRLVQAGIVLQKFPAASAEFTHDLKVAWKQVCFHHFHDTLGGTCLPSAFEDVHAQLGRALAIADEIAAITLRRHLVQFPGDPAQRLVLFNASEHPFNDSVEIEPWLEWSAWQPTWQLRDECDKLVPCQVIDPEAQAGIQVRLLFPMALAPGELKILRIVEVKDQAVELQAGLSVSASSMSAVNGPSIHLEGAGEMDLPSLGSLPVPQLVLYDDPTDTWSHGVDRFGREDPHMAAWQPAQLVDRGPLMGSLLQIGMIGSGRVQVEWRIYRDQPWLDCFLRVTWMEQRRLLKLELSLPWNVAEREDGILGGSLMRPPDGRELSLRDWTRLRVEIGAGSFADLAIVAPEVYSVAVEARRIGFTLLRSPLMAWHDPHPGTHPRGIFSDRGEHLFRFRFIALDGLSATDLDGIAFGLHRPPFIAGLARGMKNRALGGQYAPPVVA